MHRALAPFSKLESSNHTQSSADFITNTSGFSFRYTHPKRDRANIRCSFAATRAVRDFAKCAEGEEKGGPAPAAVAVV